MCACVDSALRLRYVSSMLSKCLPLRTLCSICFVTFCAISKADDWPCWRGPDHNGISKEKGWSTSWPSDGPKQLWKASVGTGFSSVSVAGGRLFTLGNRDETDTVYCFEAESGKSLWKHSYSCPLDPIYYEGGPGSTPTVDGDKLYTLSKRGHLFCFNSSDGKILWQHNLMEELPVAKPRWGFAGSPLVDGNLIAVNVGGAGAAVDKLTGKIAWRSDTNIAGYATPVPFIANGEHCAAFFSGRALIGMRLRDGNELWQFPWIERWNLNAADPLLIGNKFFISTMGQGCALLQLTADSPKSVWENKAMASHFNCGVHLNGFIYGIHGNTDQPEKDLRCIKVATGEIKWKQAGVGLGSVMIADGKLIVLSDHGELLIAPVSPDGFKPMARAQVLGGKCWTTPVLANGRIYCRNAEGTLVCLNLKN